MPNFKGKHLHKFEQFKNEAKVITLKSKETGKRKNVIKWRERIFNNADFYIVYNIIKNEI